MGLLTGNQGIFTDIAPFARNELEQRRKNNFLIDEPGTAWVRLTSNFEREDGNRKVLMGGDLEPGEALKFGFGELYEFGDSVPPQRPVPGITSVSVKETTDLTEATIKWKVNSLDQLEEMLPFFLNPGITLLLEIGWNSVDATEVLDVSNVKNIAPLYRNIHTTKNQVNNENPDDPSIFGREHPRYTNQTGKYYLLPGFLKNFDFSMNEQGGFDCTTEIQQVSESFYHLSIRVDKGERSETDNVPGSYLEFLKSDVNFSSSQDKSESGQTHSLWTHAIGDRSYIRFLDFVESINKFFELLDDNNNAQIKIGHIDVEDVKISNFIGNAEEILESPNFKSSSVRSTNPDVCIINNPPNINNTESFDNVGGAKIRSFIEEVPEDLRDRRGRLANIYLSKKFIKDKAENSNTLKGFLDKILQNCSEACFGIWNFEIGIKDGDVFIYDRNAPTDVPIDELNTGSGENEGLDEDVYLFRPYDENSQIRSIQFDSNLSDDIKNILAAKSLTVGSDNDVADKPIIDGWSDATGQFFGRFNGTDKVLPSLFMEEEDETEKQKVKQSDQGGDEENIQFDNKTIGVSAFLESQRLGLSEFDSEEDRIEELVEFRKDIKEIENWRNVFINSFEAFAIEKLLNRDKKNLSPKNSNAVLDINVSITLSGIAGLRRYQLFQINHIPDFYRKNGLFLIDNVDHSVQGNDWTTQINGKFVVGNLYNKNIQDQQ